MDIYIYALVLLIALVAIIIGIAEYIDFRKCLPEYSYGTAFLRAIKVAITAYVVMFLACAVVGVFIVWPAVALFNAITITYN